jgi:HSP20 family protein
MDVSQEREMSKKVAKTTKSPPAGPTAATPFQEIEKRLLQMEKRFADFFPESWLHPSQWEMPEWTSLGSLELTTPKVDIIDRDNDILVRADIPGVKKENLEVTLTDNTITLKGSTSEEKKEEKGDYFRSETMKGSFSRTMSLPSDVDGGKATSSFKDGVLEVVVPKLKKAHRHSVKIA